MGIGRNTSKAIGPSHQLHPCLDSDGNADIMTPYSTSSSSSNASSETDELGYVGDDRYCRQGVRLYEPRKDRKQRNNDASFPVDQIGCVEAVDVDEMDLYYATPRLGPQIQTSEVDVEPLDIGGPPSPCDSCSAAHAKAIPTVKRSPARVPITPTTPTGYADDADSESTYIEGENGERKERNSATPALPNPYAEPIRVSRPSDADKDLSGMYPKRRVDEERTLGHQSVLAAYTQEQQARFASGRASSARSTTTTTAPLDARLFWRSREAEAANAALRADERETRSVKLNGMRTETHRKGDEGSTRSLERSRSPYSHDEGGKPKRRDRAKGLWLEIPNSDRGEE